MKRILFATMIAMLGVSLASAFCGNNCGTRCRRGCPQRVERKVEPPKCCKTIQVPQTVMVDKVIEVAAIKDVTPVPDTIERRANPSIEVRTPRPPIVTPQCDLISYKCVPDTIIRHPQKPCVRYYCPDDCDQR